MPAITMDTTLFQNGKITVTTQQFVVGDNTFPIAALQGVEGVTKAQEYDKGIWWVFIGGGLFFEGWAEDTLSTIVRTLIFLCGAGAFLWGVVSCVKEKPSYWIVLITASGREVVVKDEDKALVDQTVEALQQAVSAAGA